jgi:hypothetical protein
MLLALCGSGQQSVYRSGPYTLRSPLSPGSTTATTDCELRHLRVRRCRSQRQRRLHPVQGRGRRKESRWWWRRCAWARGVTSSSAVERLHPHPRHADPLRHGGWVELGAGGRPKIQQCPASVVIRSRQADAAAGERTSSMHPSSGTSPSRRRAARTGDLRQSCARCIHGRCRRIPSPSLSTVGWSRTDGAGQRLPAQQLDAREVVGWVGGEGAWWARRGPPSLQIWRKQRVAPFCSPCRTPLWAASPG